MIDEISVWYRWFMLFTTVVILIAAVWQIKAAFRDLPLALKSFYLGGVFAMIYIADACREAAEMQLGFRWRLIPLTFSVMLFGAYVGEPKSSRERRKRIVKEATHLFYDPPSSSETRPLEDDQDSE